LDTVFTVGVGFTVMVNAEEVPPQLFTPLEKVGVTVMVAVTGETPLFTAVNEGIFPVPLAGSPIDEAELVHV
jgi:hypothetical protein